MKRKLTVIAGFVMIILAACSNKPSNDGYDTPHQYFPGEEIGLVYLWTVDDSGAERGSATFPLYSDDEDYYVDFHGTPYKLHEMSPVDVGGNVLCYSMPTEFGTYYLEDVSNPSCRFYNK